MLDVGFSWALSIKTPVSQFVAQKCFFEAAVTGQQSVPSNTTDAAKVKYSYILKYIFTRFLILFLVCCTQVLLHETSATQRFITQEDEK